MNRRARRKVDKLRAAEAMLSANAAREVERLGFEQGLADAGADYAAAPIAREDARDADDVTIRLAEDGQTIVPEYGEHVHPGVRGAIDIAVDTAQAVTIEQRLGEALRQPEVGKMLAEIPDELVERIGQHLSGVDDEDMDDPGRAAAFRSAVAERTENGNARAYQMLLDAHASAKRSKNEAEARMKDLERQLGEGRARLAAAYDPLLAVRRSEMMALRALEAFDEE